MSADDILSRAQPPADARIAYGSDPNQFGDLRLPQTQPSAISRQPLVEQKRIETDKAGPKASQKQQQRPLHPVVMNIHGGFWRAKYDLLHASHLCAALTRAGAATWNLEYRRVGNAGGAWPGTFEDITNGYRFLRQIARTYDLDLTRLVVMGHSAGGHLAVALAGHQAAKQNAEKQEPGKQSAGKASGAAQRIRGAVSLAGVLDLKRAWELHLSNDAVVEFLGGTPAEMPDHYREADPMQLAVKAEQHIIHGTDDDVVPVEISRKYVAAKQAQGEKVTLTELPKCGHYEVIDPESAVWGRIEGIVTGLLKAH